MLKPLNWVKYNQDSFQCGDLTIVILLWDTLYLYVDIFNPEREQTLAFLDHLPTSCCPRSHSAKLTVVSIGILLRILKEVRGHLVLLTESKFYCHNYTKIMLIFSASCGVAEKVDVACRILFPASFLLFNLFYWWFYLVD